MVTRSVGLQLVAATLIAVLVLGWQTSRHGDFIGLFFTPDQRGLHAYENLGFQRAAELFVDPAWKGVAAYRSGQYELSASSFGRIPTAQGFFNRGNALMKGRDYRQAVTAYEQAVAEDPSWQEATENLRLARYVVDYIERAREQSDTGDETELSADDYVFDNEEERGREMEITKESTVELESAEKWMRSVDTETRDFLRSRFLLESVQEQDQ